MDVYFSDLFDVSAATIEKYGAFDISLVQICLSLLTRSCCAFSGLIQVSQD